MTKIMIDGYNMIHRVPNFARFLEVSLERAREELLRKLKSYALAKSVLLIVVFDGSMVVSQGRPVNPGNLKVIFSRPPFKADPKIKDLIMKEKNKKNLTLVSDDADLVQFAKSHEAKVLTTGAFADILGKRFRSKEISNEYDQQELSEKELNEWLDIFGEGE